MNNATILIGTLGFFALTACASQDDGASTGDDQNVTENDQCFSNTLGRNVEKGTCVQDNEDDRWFRCSLADPARPFAVVTGPEDTSCKKTVPLPNAQVCHSQTLGKHVSDGVCVQDSQDLRWFRCEGTSSRWQDLGAQPNNACNEVFPFKS